MDAWTNSPSTITSLLLEKMALANSRKLFPRPLAASMDPWPVNSTKRPPRPRPSEPSLGAELSQFSLATSLSLSTDLSGVT